MGSMSVSDAAPLPRLGEAFFDVRGSSRSMRLSWYANTGIAVFSIWQGGTCTGTFRLPVDELSRLVDSLHRGLPEDSAGSQQSSGPIALGGQRPRLAIGAAPAEPFTGAMSALTDDQAAAYGSANGLTGGAASASPTVLGADGQYGAGSSYDVGGARYNTAAAYNGAEGYGGPEQYTGNGYGSSADGYYNAATDYRQDTTGRGVGRAPVGTGAQPTNLSEYRRRLEPADSYSGGLDQYGSADRNGAGQDQHGTDPQYGAVGQYPGEQYGTADRNGTWQRYGDEHYGDGSYGAAGQAAEAERYAASQQQSAQYGQSPQYSDQQYSGQQQYGTAGDYSERELTWSGQQYGAGQYGHDQSTGARYESGGEQQSDAPSQYGEAQYGEAQPYGTGQQHAAFEYHDAGLHHDAGLQYGGEQFAPAPQYGQPKVSSPYGDAQYGDAQGFEGADQYGAQAVGNAGGPGEQAGYASQSFSDSQRVAGLQVVSGQQSSSNGYPAQGYDQRGYDERGYADPSHAGGAAGTLGAPAADSAATGAATATGAYARAQSRGAGSDQSSQQADRYPLTYRDQRGYSQGAGAAISNGYQAGTGGLPAAEDNGGAGAFPSAGYAASGAVGTGAFPASGQGPNGYGPNGHSGAGLVSSGPYQRADTDLNTTRTPRLVAPTFTPAPGTGGFSGPSGQGYPPAAPQANWPGDYAPDAQQAGVPQAQEGYGPEYPSGNGLPATGQAEPRQQGYWDGDQYRGNWS